MTTVRALEAPRAALPIMPAPKPKFQFKPFQREDLALAGLKDGVILSWDTGLGKTIAAYAWPRLKGAKRVLIVAPEGLHKQLRDTGRDLFGALVLPLENIARFYGWKLHRPPPDLNRPLYYLTSYQQLGANGADEWAPKLDLQGNAIDVWTRRQAREKWLEEHGIEKGEEYHTDIGKTVNGITCVWKPSLARVILQHNSFDCVVVDEGTRLQANDSHIGLGVRLLEPVFRLILTATPVKNRLESLFWLAWWVAGGAPDASALWPYAGTSAAKEEFGNHHLQIDRYLTREEAYFERTGRNREMSRRSARVTNIHRLWKLIAPLIVRRTKINCGEDIVKRTLRPVSMPPGTEQWKIYKHYLENLPVRTSYGTDMKGKSATGVQINFLRNAALCPWDMGPAPRMVENGRHAKHQFNPKMWLVLSVVAECLERGEQVVVGSPFRAFSDALHARLLEAGVGSVLLDGRISPKRRGALVGDFKDGKYAVIAAGTSAMAEGHSLECCPNLVLPSLAWPYDENKQFIDRVWRINSPKPVNIYLPTLENTVDLRLATVFGEKSDTANLVLDGDLPEDIIEEANIFAFMRGVEADSLGDVNTINEEDLLARWPALRTRLGCARNAKAS